MKASPPSVSNTKDSMLTLLNTQEPQRVDRDPDGTVNVHSIFRTIQGEGPFAGRAALFMRLHGCNLQCPGCDTEYTRKSYREAPDYLHELIKTFYEWPSGLVVITGGEPFRQNITPLVTYLIEQGYEVQIETNGVLYPGDDFPWAAATVVCSPKTGKIHPRTAHKVTAYKYVLSHDGVMPDGLPERALGHPLRGHSHVARPPADWHGPVYVQPMDSKDEIENRRNLRAVVDTVIGHPDKNYIMGVQMHKLTGLP